MHLKATHFKKNKMADANPLDKASYKFLESDRIDRHMKTFMMQTKFKKVDELTPRGFKPRSQFHREECNPLDIAPAVAMHPELDGKLKTFFKGSAKKFSVNRPIDSKETFIASGGPSQYIVSAREVGR